MNHEHLPVLLEEVVDGLAIKPNGIYIDATFGRGGHSQAILDCLNKEGKLLVMDKDLQAIATAKERFGNDPRVVIVHASFAELEAAAEKQGWIGDVDGILLDLGVSSPQLNEASRGFSFMREGPLDMRMDTSKGIDAATWLMQVEEKELANVLWKYGEERFSRRIARTIINQREISPINSTLQLAELITKSVPKKEHHKNPSTRSFQAIRIFINNELEELKKVLHQSVNVLKKGGRLCVISFHSLEDRIVKQFIAQHTEVDAKMARLPIKESQIRHRLKKVGKLISPGDEEIGINPRARSARLRIAERAI
jgi:16S rRNA (cytosine1402-N4)-methyltransferase